MPCHLRGRDRLLVKRVHDESSRLETADEVIAVDANVVMLAEVKLALRVEDAAKIMG